MSLSKINESPVYPTTLPSTGQKIKFRPFLVKEERSLLTANESEDVPTMYASLEAVVRNCITPNNIHLTTFDVEYLFVQIRSKSVGETSDIIINCSSCQTDNQVTLDLKQCEVEIGSEHSKKLKLSDNLTLTMRYPSIDELLDINTAKSKDAAVFATVKTCIDTVFFKDDIYVIAEESDDEIRGFIDTLTSPQYAKLKEFVDTMPHTAITHKWVCKKCGVSHETSLRGIFSFF